VKCTKISHCIGKITSTFDKQVCSYLRCSEIKKLCGDCKKLKSKKSAKKTKKSTKKKGRGKSSVSLEGLEGSVKKMEPINEEPFHISITNPKAAQLWARTFADVPDIKKELTMPLYEGDYMKDKKKGEGERPAKKSKQS